MQEWVFSADVIAILFALACAAGFIDSIAGGGGLLTIPALLALGVPPAQALGTNKLQAIGGSFSASLYFIHKGAVNLRNHTFSMLCVLLGSVIGAILVQHIQAELLRQILPLLIITIGVYFLLTPNLGLQDSHQRLGYLAFGLICGIIGFYDGFFGPGAGSFYALIFVVLYGFNLAKATAHAKVLNFISNLGGLALFIIGGKIIWSIGLVMLCGQVLGARLGAHMVLTRGQRLIRPMIVIVSLLMSGKLIYENHAEQIWQWFVHYF